MENLKALIMAADMRTLSALQGSLGGEGYEVLVARQVGGALDITRRESPDVVFLDIASPGPGGFEICRSLRRETDAPIFILSELTDETDKIIGLDMGADDYIIKPFSMRELVTRLHNKMRRRAGEIRRPAPSALLQFQDIELDSQRRQASRRGHRLELSPKEFDLLAHFIRHKSLVFSRRQLMDAIWGYWGDDNSRKVDVHVHLLRQKIEADPTHPRHLVTVRCLGYKLID
jgi:two-component system OmpR family response regulator